MVNGRSQNQGQKLLIGTSSRILTAYIYHLRSQAGDMPLPTSTLTNQSLFSMMSSARILGMSFRIRVYFWQPKVRGVEMLTSQHGLNIGRL
jgi:hypothetical protein